jgi:Tfp pilus assembly ATPase PilU
LKFGRAKSNPDTAATVAADESDGPVEGDPSVELVSDFSSQSSPVLEIAAAESSAPQGIGLAAVIDWVRRYHHKHVVTIEDPIEYCYPGTIEVPGGLRPAPALVAQQEVGHHVRDFEQGLADALRKKPDIILVGEIRRAETLAWRTNRSMRHSRNGHAVSTDQNQN